jgi:diguanylate cyclase (GGDEF)-like protein
MLAGLALTVAFGAIDYVTGNEISLSVLYLIPAGIVTWFAGGRQGAIIAFAGAVAYLWSDIAAGAFYSNFDIAYWNAGIRFLSFLVVVWLLSALYNTLANERALARTDALTGALNRRFFLDLLVLEMARSRRYDHPFALAYLDLDDFKAVNDRWGHHIGDQVLRTVVEAIQANLRETDQLGRLGGDEFAVILTEIAPEEAQVVMEDIRRAVAETMRRNEWPVTLSVGLLSCQGPTTDTEDILRLADNLMYVAKRGGKDALITGSCHG